MTFKNLITFSFPYSPISRQSAGNFYSRGVKYSSRRMAASPDAVVSDLSTHADGSCRLGFHRRLSVCLFFFRKTSQKTTQCHQTWHPNVPRWVLETHLFWVKRLRSRVTNTLPAWVFALFWVLASSSLTMHVFHRRHFDDWLERRIPNNNIGRYAVKHRVIGD